MKFAAVAVDAPAVAVGAPATVHGATVKVRAQWMAHAKHDDHHPLAPTRRATLGPGRPEGGRRAARAGGCRRG